MKKYNLATRALSVILALCIIIPCIPIISLVGSAAPGTGVAVADPSTANNYHQMLGTDADGNRYSGRVWFDKSVFTYGDEASLPLHSDFSGLAADTIKIDSNFMVVGSALGSTTSVVTTTSVPASLDVVIVLDNSGSMENVSDGTTRFEKVRDAANKLIGSITSNGNNRLAIVAYSSDSQEILPLDYYKEKTNVLSLTETGYGWNKNYQFTASATSLDSSSASGRTFNGSSSGTNVQSGVNQGMKILANATEIEGRIPVIILLTDGETNHAVDTDWYNVASGNIRNDNYTFHKQVAVSTLLNAGYMKYKVSTNYSTPLTVYGIGVDLEDGSNANVVMDPANTVKSTATGLAKETYDLLETWKNSNVTVESYYNSSLWEFPQLPSNFDGTKQDVIDNINYVDKYYGIGSENLSGVFDEILIEINEKAFVPLVDKVVQGEVEIDTPLTYVDYIGDYMEVKEFKAVTLFGKIYSVSKSLEAPVITDTVNSDGTVTRKAVTTYIVQSDTVTNPSLGTTFDVADAVKITVTETYIAKNVNGVYEKIGVGKQEVRASIPAAALPLIYDKVVNNQGVITYETNRGEVVPLRLYYTVDIVDSIIDANGDIITDHLSAEYLAKNTNSDGTISFYPGQYGVMNPAETINGVTDIYKGDAHAEATPALDNRFYYHQNNYPVYITATDKNGDDIVWDADEYGVLYYQGNGIDQTLNDAYKTEYLLYSQVSGLADADQVYTMVAFYRPTTGGAGEAVGYLVYTDWQYLKDSLAYYDDVNKVYINGYENGAFVTSATEGYNVSADVVDAYIAAKGIDKSDVICALGIDTWRTSRLHNMIVSKTTNVTDTAENVVVPVKNEDALHDGNLVAWLGNNGKLTLVPQQGLSVTKTVDQAVSGAETEFEVTVTVNSIDFTPKFLDSDGNSFNSVPVLKNTDTLKTTITLTLTAGETVYITNLPTGVTYTVSEAASNYYKPSYTNEAGVIAANTVTAVSIVNSPKTYGDLVISKEVIHPFGGNLDNEFDFVLTIAGITQWEADNKLSVPAGASVSVSGNIATVTGIKITDGSSVTVTGIPVGAVYTVQEKPEKGFALDTAKTTGIAGNISSAVSYADFVNNYDPNPPVNATLTVSGTKTFTTNTDGDWTFNFKVQELMGDGTYVDVSGATASVNMTTGGTKDYSIVFDALYTNVGTHYYRVVEVGGSDAHMTYDTTEGLFKVTVSDPGVIDGVLMVDVEAVSDSSVSSEVSDDIEHFTVDVDFENHYNANGTHAELNIQKILNNNTGVSIPLNIFEFELKQGSAVIDTVHTDASGKAVISLPIDAAGTYEYTLSEVDGGKAGMTYDGAVYTVTVTAQNVGGQLVATLSVNGTESNTATFTNTYSLEPVSVTLNGSKILQNKTLEAGKFSFEIYEADEVYHALTNGYTATVSNAESGTFSFALPQYTKAGTYRYVVKEVIPAAAHNNLLNGITYDTSVYHVTVVISDDGNGKLASSVQISKLGAGSVSGITFTNVYKAVGQEQLTFEGEKTLIGRNLSGDEFTFTIEIEKDGVSLPSINTTNLSTGKIQFPTFTYTEADIGSTYTYRVYEVIPTDALNGVYLGVTYSKTVYSVTVSVKDNGEGGIVLDIIGDYEGLDFTNTYNSQSVSVGLDGIKTLNGRELEEGEFEFVLKNSAGTEIETVFNKADGTFVFADLTFTSAGIYKYTVSEVKGGKGGVAYDETVYTVTITVTDNGKGFLNAQTVISGSGTLSFTNIYTTENVTVSIPGVKTLEGRKLEAGEFTFGIYRANVVDGKFEINGDVVVTATNDENGNFVFPEGVFTTPGTSYFVIKEINGGESGITYDTTVYNMTVTVTDNGEGKLVADVAITDIGGNKAELKFNNVFTPADLPVSFGGTKLYNKTLAAGDFSFQLKDEDGNLLQTVSNDASGNYKFDIVYTASDIGKTFKYTVSEVNGGKGGVTYDNTVYTVTVTVTDNGEGELVATVSGGEAITFTNEYSALNASVTVNGIKNLVGKELSEGMFSFLLKDKDGNVLRTVTNDGDGKIVFAAIEFDKVGEYAYTVTEVIGTEKGMNYDETVYTVTVTVTDNGEGQLEASVTVSGDGVIEFNNEYVPETPQLGDDNGMYIWFAAMLASAVGLAVLTFKKRKAV